MAFTFLVFIIFIGLGGLIIYLLVHYLGTVGIWITVFLFVIWAIYIHLVQNRKTGRSQDPPSTGSANNMSRESMPSIGHENSLSVKENKNPMGKNELKTFPFFRAIFIQVSEEFGEDIYSQERLTYILDDYHAFREDERFKDLFALLIRDSILTALTEGNMEPDEAARFYALQTKDLDYTDILSFLKELERTVKIINSNKNNGTEG